MRIGGRGLEATYPKPCVVRPPAARRIPSPLSGGSFDPALEDRTGCADAWRSRACWRKPGAAFDHCAPDRHAVRRDCPSARRHFTNFCGCHNLGRGPVSGIVHRIGVLCMVGLAAWLIAGSTAKAEVLSLICSDSTGGYDFWVDLGRSTVTQGFPWASGAKGYPVFPATITPATFAWAESDGGRTSIDRGTGRMTFFQPGGGARYFQCSKASVPMPVTHF